MFRKALRVGFLCKAGFIGLFIIFVIQNGGLPAASNLGGQSFDFGSSIIVSVGFGTALCLLLHSRKIK
jgi:hypothetical protein